MSTIRALYYTLYHQHHHHGLSTPISYHGECSGEARFVQRTHRRCQMAIDAPLSFL